MELKIPEVRVLITGGSGFIGTNLVDFFVQKGIEVCNIDNSPPLNPKHVAYWYRQDILDGKGLLMAFKKFVPTYVVHLAARTDIYEANSIEDYAANTVGTQNVLLAVSQTPSIHRIIIASSMLVCRVGYAPKSDTDYSPPNLYGQSKVFTETITRDFNLEAPWTIIRPTTIWGPWSIRYRDEFFSVLRKGWYIHPGKKRIMKTYGYVGNVVHQINAILHAPMPQVNGKTFYVGDPPLDLREWVDGFSLLIRGQSVREAPLAFMRLLAWIGDLLGKCGIRFPLTGFRLGNMTADNVLDMSPILHIAGVGFYTLANGIEETVLWLNDEVAEKPS